MDVTKESNYFEVGRIDDTNAVNVNGHADEDDMPITQTPEPAVYWYRWYIAILFSLIGFVQNVIWNSWSPIAISALCAFGFTSTDIEWLANWGPVTMLLFMPLYSWLLNSKEMRKLILSTGVLMTIAGVLRCLPLPSHVYKYFVHFGQISNGIAGCVVMAAPPLLSNSWFPTGERITATSLLSLLPPTGVGVIYIVAPAIVQEPSHEFANETFCNISNEEKSAIQHDIMTLMYIEVALSAFLLVCCFIFFPSKPPSPPSVTASIQRLNFKEALFALSKNIQFILAVIVVSLVIGVYIGFLGILDEILSPFGMSQESIGMIGFISAVAGCGVGLIVGRLADKWKGRTRIILVIWFGIAFLSSIYFMIITNNWFHVKGLQYSDAGAWTSLLLVGIVLFAAPGIANELAAESGYPAGEGVATGILMWITNVVCFTLLFTLSLTNDIQLAIYISLASMAVAMVILIVFIREPNNRVQIDHNEQTTIGTKDTSPLIANEVCT